MKRIGRVFSLIIVVTLISKVDIKAQQASNMNCPEVSQFNILYLAPILLNEENKEQKISLGIKEYDISTYKFDESDSLLLDNIAEYWLKRDVSVVTEDEDCTFINQSLTESNILETLPSSIDKFFYRIEDRFIVFFQEAGEEGGIVISAKALPVLLIDRQGAIHELLTL